MGLVPPELVTVTSTTPAPAGEVAVIVVGELTVKLALLAPNLTAVTATKLVPSIVTTVPPVCGPAFGVTLATVGP